MYMDGPIGKCFLTANFDKLLHQNTISGAEKVKDRINPELEHRQVDPRLKQGLSAARWVSSHTVKASGYLVSKAGDASLALGRFLGKLHNS